MAVACCYQRAARRRPGRSAGPNLKTMSAAHDRTPGGKPRARGLGLPFAGRPGPWNAVTDVPGVEVGYVTLIEGDRVRTGVTAIHPRGRPVPATPWRPAFTPRTATAR